MCIEGYVPYGWQFPGEDVFIAVEKGFGRNCWGFVSQDNEGYWATTACSITACFVGEQLDVLSFRIDMSTVVILDNASVNPAGIIQQRRRM